MMPAHEAGEEYTGPAELIGRTSEPIAVEVNLRGHLEPIDGHYYWYGRIAVNDVLAQRHRSGSDLVLRTPHGSAAGRISDVDPWGRFRIKGVGAPPF